MHVELATGQLCLADAVFFSCGPDACAAASQCLWLASTPSNIGCTNNRQSLAAMRADLLPGRLVHRLRAASLSMIELCSVDQHNFKLAL
jgi:hypothetical protein